MTVSSKGPAAEAVLRRLQSAETLISLQDRKGPTICRKQSKRSKALPTALPKAQILVRRRTFQANRKWSSWETVYARPSSPSQHCFVYTFPLGGQLRIYPDCLSVEQQTTVSEELLQWSYFRQYTIQNNPEPRAHFLLHEEATEDFDNEPQPGYKYGCIRMKARPLRHLPEVEQLAYVMQTCIVGAYPPSEECFWNIGVMPVLYRDGRDRMGFHADDDQGEQLIVTALVSSPRVRRMSIRPMSSKTVGNVVGDQQLELFLGAGDAYSMDGAMQKHYLHSVPSDKKCCEASVPNTDSVLSPRIAVVFRQGTQCLQYKDSGKPLASLLPRVRLPYLYGNCIGPLKEGATYSRVQLLELNAHRSPQRGVSGNRTDGCDAIIVSGLRPDGLGYDHLLRLMYAAGAREGSHSIFRSSVEGKPIRVFRSSILKSPYRAVHTYQTRRGSRTSASATASASSLSACYRYDGLYRVTAVRFKEELYELSSGRSVVSAVSCSVGVSHLEEHIKIKVPASRVYLFYLERVDQGQGVMTNDLSSDAFLARAMAQHTLSPEAEEACWLDHAGHVDMLSQSIALEEEVFCCARNLDLLRASLVTKCLAMEFGALQTLATACETVETLATACETVQPPATEFGALQTLATACESVQPPATACETVELVTKCLATACETVETPATACETVETPATAFELLCRAANKLRSVTKHLVTSDYDISDASSVEETPRLTMEYLATIERARIGPPFAVARPKKVFKATILVLDPRKNRSMRKGKNRSMRKEKKPARNFSLGKKETRTRQDTEQGRRRSTRLQLQQLQLPPGKRKRPAELAVQQGRGKRTKTVRTVPKYGLLGTPRKSPRFQTTVSGKPAVAKRRNANLKRGRTNTSCMEPVDAAKGQVAYCPRPKTHRVSVSVSPSPTRNEPQTPIETEGNAMQRWWSHLPSINIPFWNRRGPTLCRKESESQSNPNDTTR
jgi:alkylated DNA repair dioxygenase AlkB